ncbi:class E sortase [Labedaea rhizosphaerae]|uniref:LPXTG-site transpeptidase (Sortase) family protein n=1 Tax=Labedaea rhizosphaerae TaxID=598644 RepID=A0A4V3CZX2_LABRH|nr:class E sortase [Labedaea rhizosphaerae]TDQ01371.1 LPXTG-site transpeptidase (sortase) family protein [Labedaea rhizosphaerae]
MSADAPTEAVLPVVAPVDRGRPAPAPGPVLPEGEPPLLSGRGNGLPPSERPTELISRVADAPTDLIDRIDDGYYDDDYDDYYEDDDYYDEDGDEEPPKDKVSAYAKLAGEILLTAGMVVLLFVVYEVWITDLISAGRQADATAALDQQWNQGGAVDDGRTEHLSAADGQGIAKLYIPALGEDYKFTIIEGTTDDDLAIGPGHYTRSQLPGQPGNFAVAGHRVGKGAPFNDIDLVEPCDAIIVETKGDWYVYRMLPLDDGSTGWANNPLCRGPNGEQKVNRLTGPYAKTTGRTIVDPSQGEVVDAIPGQPDSAVPADDRKALLTLTTCHPKFSNAQRMIVHAVLVKHWTKAQLGGKLPVELQETS